MLIEDTKALEALKHRLEHKPEKIDDSRLPAGSSMHFYCRICEHLSDVLPESYWGSPAKYCGPCKELKTAYPKLTDATIREEAMQWPRPTQSTA